MAADKWMVSDRIDAADAAVVLGGGAARPYSAAELYHSGLVSRILVDEDDNRKIVLNLNIPPQAVVTFGSGLRNTYEEACALADWTAPNTARRFVIPTESFPSRRVQWIFSRKLKDLGATIMIKVIPAMGSAPGDWWLNGNARDQFSTELLKYFYYRVRYPFAHC
jgi:uncharacterized SAM-binding protein YcdF (DUF218 family)